MARYVIKKGNKYLAEMGDLFGDYKYTKCIDKAEVFSDTNKCNLIGKERYVEVSLVEKGK